MKKLFLILFLFGLQTAVLFAQDDMPPGGPGGGPGMRSPKERVKELTVKLKLTTEQAGKIESVFTKEESKMQKMFQNGPEGDFETMRKTMDAVQDSSTAAINKILNQEQKVLYKKILEEKKKEMEKMGPPPQGVALKKVPFNVYKYRIA